MADHTSTFTLAAAPASGSSGRKLTYQDAMEHLFQRAPQLMDQAASTQQMRASVLGAYDKIVHAHDWTWLKGLYVLQGVASYSTGTVAYDHDTRQVTLSDGTWPTWAASGSLYLDSIVCDVSVRNSGTVVTLSADRNPGADVAAGASYTILRQWYALPADFLSVAEPLGEGVYVLGEYVSWQDMADLHRSDPSTGDFQNWTIGPAPTGGQALWVWPGLSAAVRFELPYKKRPRNLLYSGHDARESQGTISVSTATVTGSGTAFESGMAGAVLRISRTSTRPTGLTERNPYFEEAVISSVASTTAATLATSMTAASAKAYVVTDPIDFERTCWDAMLAEAEMRLTPYGSKQRRDAERWAGEALRLAKEADCPALPRQVAGMGGIAPRRLRDFYTP